MKIAIGCDHGALALKNKVATHLEKQGIEVKTEKLFGREFLEPAKMRITIEMME